jgi:hypothetical protein
MKADISSPAFKADPFPFYARLRRRGARVVTVFPDRVERYFTTELFRPYQ